MGLLGILSQCGDDLTQSEQRLVYLDGFLQHRLICSFALLSVGLAFTASQIDELELGNHLHSFAFRTVLTNSESQNAVTPRRLRVHLVSGHDFVLETFEKPGKSVFRRLTLVLEHVLDSDFVCGHVPLKFQTRVFALVQLPLRLLVQEIVDFFVVKLDVLNVHCDARLWLLAFPLADRFKQVFDCAWDQALLRRVCLQDRLHYLV